MLLKATIYASLLGLCSILAAASPSKKPYLPKDCSPSNRPDISFAPHQPWRPLPKSPRRTKTCYVPSHNDGVTDDSAAILAELKACNNGGHVVFPRGLTYTIGTALDLTFLRHIDLDIQGTWRFTNDTSYWQAHGFHFTYQNATTFFQLGGQDVNVFGGGTLDGNGQAWYDLFAVQPLILRPILFAAIGLQGGLVANLNLRNSPQWFNLLANSSDVVYSGLTMDAKSTSKSFISNTDGWDVLRSTNVVIQDSTINNGDDCVSFKPNATEILVQNLSCNGSHGISVGSLGQYIGEVDIVQDVLVSNIHMSNASDGARIKVWPGINSQEDPSLSGGGGSGMVKNIRYENMVVNNVDYAIEVTQCYGQSNQTLCNEFPANLTISDVVFSSFSGTTSTKHSPVSGSVVCSAPNVCSNISATDIHVTSPAGTVDQFVCVNVDDAALAVNCSSTAPKSSR